MLLFTLLIAGRSAGQYGNEWINFNQDYFKLKVAEDGLYRVSVAELEAVGFPSNTVAAERLRLFKGGQEVAMLVSSSSGRLEYLEFYGQRNDGRSDAGLYFSNAQPHPFYSLFSDTTTYFLTYSATGGQGSRMAFSTDNSSDGLTPDSYHLQELRLLQTTRYSGGIQFGIGNDFSLSQYDFGEGWTGPAVGKGSSEDYNFQLNRAVTSGPVPQLELVLIGANSLQHVVEILAGPTSSSLRSLGTATFNDRTSLTVNFDLAWSDVDPSGALVIRMNVVGIEGQSDFVSTSYAEITFPQSFQLNSGEQDIFHLNTTTGGKTYLQVASDASSSTRLFDITTENSPIRINTNPLAGQVDLVVNGTTTSRKVLGVTGTKTVPEILSYSFQQIDLTAVDYIMISHPELRKNSSAGSDPVQAFKTYRESEAGGGWNVALTNIEDVYDQYGYGNPTPQAIQNMLQEGYDGGSLKLLFLVGKGTTANLDFYRKRDVVHYIPTYGVPGSDLLFGVGLNGDDLDPVIGVGRITARTSDEVQAYLNKVIESEATLYNDLWRKRIIHLSGGQNASELNLFAAIVDGFSAAAEKEFVGALTENFSKETTATVEFIDIRSEVNEGLGMITFFGHSGSDVTDIEVGDVATFSNKGFYPFIFLVNGCNAGQIFSTGISFGEPWVLTADKGSASFIAHTGTATSSGLRRYSDLFYEVAFNDSLYYGSTLGEISAEVGRRYFDQTTAVNAQSQVYQMVLQGDPAARLFAAEKTDYAIQNSEIFTEAIFGDQILTSQDSFKISLIVKNFGKTSHDSVKLKIDRTLPDGKLVTQDRIFERVLNEDTIDIFVTNDFTGQVEGNHVFQFSLDPDNAINELDETNNLASIEVFIAAGNTLQLFPINDGLVEGPSIKFVWQTFDPFAGQSEFDFELDTASTFSSGFKIQSVESGNLLLEKNLDLGGLPDSTVVYWRTRFSNSENDTLWNTSRFTIFSDLPETGWGHFEVDQLATGSTSGITLNATNSQWEFTKTSNPIDVTAFGFKNQNLQYEDIEVLVNNVDLMTTLNTFDPVCRSNTLNAVVFDRQTSNPYLPITFSQVGVFNALVCGRIPQLVHNFTEDNLLGEDRWIEQLIDNMSNGDQILLFNIDSIAFSQWDDQLKNKLAEVGIDPSTVNGLADGQPIIFFGKKGELAGSATTVVSDNTSSPANEQVLRLIDEAEGSFTEGSIQSPAIGPAKRWDKVDFNVSSGSGDNFTLNVIGISPEGNEIQQFTSARITDELDLSTLDAQEFPSIRLNFDFTDNSNATPPQLRNWTVQYEYPADGILLMADPSPLTLQEGDSVQRDFYFYNYTDTDFEDSIQVFTRFRNVETGNVIGFSASIAAPNSGDSASYLLNEGTLGRVGDFNLNVNMTANDRELYSVNNNINAGTFLKVESDNLNPVLDVTFDGTYILNGDIVSPTPLVNILVKDQNPILRKSDTTGISIELRTGDDGNYERVPFSSPKVVYTPATEEAEFTIRYEPGPLDDNRYALRVSASDESGNESGLQPYEITFEVINESTITYFYPYPNPFSTSTRFVFTLTGSELPDQLKIQIMTVTGRVVREILQDEIGPMKIGNNISQYAWDGRDEYGDQLANGVYLYRVIAKINGEDIKNRGTAADQAFKNGFGKLYILR